MHDDGKGGSEGGLAACLDDATLTPGQRKRLSIFQSVESLVCARIEELCADGGVEVSDVAVLMIAPEAHGLFFEETEAPGISVLIGHRGRILAFLDAALPPANDAPSDPYEDLRKPAPPRCVRVLVIDHESLTVLSYGTFVTVRLDPDRRAVA